jgi:hypothetical protein
VLYMPGSAAPKRADRREALRLREAHAGRPHGGAPDCGDRAKPLEDEHLISPGAVVACPPTQLSSDRGGRVEVVRASL